MYEVTLPGWGDRERECPFCHAKIEGEGPQATSKKWDSAYQRRAKDEILSLLHADGRIAHKRDNCEGWLLTRHILLGTADTNAALGIHKELCSLFESASDRAALGERAKGLPHKSSQSRQS
jgi:hypothetical protein